MTRRLVTFFDPFAADQTNLDATVEAIMAAIVEQSSAVGQAKKKAHDPIDGYRSGLATRSAP